MQSRSSRRGRQGGQIFLTSKETLTTSSPYFKRLLDGEHFAPSLDAHGRVFVDRDGELFPTLLTLMRSGITDVKPGTDVRRLASEAAYFGLTLDETELKRRDPTQADVLNLNVGGRIFSTTRETLSKSKPLRQLLERMDRNEAPLDSAGRYPLLFPAVVWMGCWTIIAASGRLFVDRDPDAVEVVLRLLQGYTLLT